jgi:hypothetical protein
MKWTKSALLVVVIPALALLFLGQNARPPAAEAKPTAIITVNWTLCLTLTTTIDWNDNGHIDAGDSTVAFFDCYNGLSDEAKFDNMIGAIRGISDTPADPTRRADAIKADFPKPTDFTAPHNLTPMDSEAGQLHEEDGRMWVINFVSNDDPLAVYADKGMFEASGKAVVRCGPTIGPDYDITDEDCDGDGVRGDGVVAVMLLPNGASRGPATLRLRQDNLEFEDTYTVVGEPFSIELTASKSVIQTGAPICALFSDTPSFLATLGAPEKSPLTAVVKDSDGTPITGAMVAYEVESEAKDTAVTAMPLTPTLSSPLGINSPNVICGDENTGEISVSARISRDAAPGVTVEPAAHERHVEVPMTVKGPPVDMALSVSPASLVCDGTAGAAVTATLTDAEGNPVVDGNTVHFFVGALGTVAPIDAKSAGGAATATVTPLSDVLKGITVDATLLTPALNSDDEEILVPTDIEKSILVQCSSPSTQPAPAPGGPTAPTISPPSTGDGGYLPGG